MTPAPISVERFKLTLVGDINGLLGPFPAVKASPQGEYVLHSDYAALLHQLAERDAEVERLRRECDLRKRAVDRWVPCPDHRDKVDGRCQVCAKEAAERAREGACGLLEEALVGWDDVIEGLELNGLHDDPRFAYRRHKKWIEEVQTKALAAASKQE